MKKIAVTVAVLALGLAGCAQNNEADTAENDLMVENEVVDDMNMSMDATNAADNALENAGESIENAAESVENAAESVENAQ